MHIWKGKNIAFVLDLTSLSLTELPPVTVWKELQGTTNIFLDNNCLSGEELLKLNSITSFEEISVDDNTQLNIIPNEIISKQKNLTTFTARNCNLSLFPSGLLSYPQLSDIILSKNNIAYIPESFCSCLDNLRNFEISDNNLTQLPSDMGYLHNLETIDLKGNPLYDLSPLDGLVDVSIDI
jgi:Leucine-rich repeat (LRR) protein